MPNGRYAIGERHRFPRAKGGYMRRTFSVLTIAMVVVAAGAIAGSAATPKTPPTKQEIAKRILATPAGKTLTATARIALEAIARGDHRAAPDSNGLSAPVTIRLPKGLKPGGGPLPNVRVNDPSKDSNQIEQTTQSETSIAVSGSNVAVGYNDSQRTLLFLTAASDLSGVSYSTDGGQTFTDGGSLPNAPGRNNFGDPWLATDSNGTMYYSNLVLDFSSFSLLVGVAKSTDGGKTWSQATPIPPPPGNELGYMADKDAMVAAGPGNRRGRSRAAVLCRMSESTTRPKTRIRSTKRPRVKPRSRSRIPTSRSATTTPSGPCSS